MQEITVKKGDYVRKPKGQKVAIVTNIQYGYIYCKYLDGSSTFSVYTYGKNGSTKELVFAENPEELVSTSGLFTFTEGSETKFAKLIGKNDQGNYVLEVKGGGGIFVKAPADVIEVRPYTVSVKFFSSQSEFTYELPKGSVNLHDVVLSNLLGLGMVVALDTQKDRARNGSELRRIPTEALMA